jgi:peptidoglycan/xylan/chitin deacetylase (PgdA/CDA1 family)
MPRRFKRSLFRAARTSGVFGPARRKTKGALRILGYHGVSVTDEHEFRGALFMPPDLLRERLDWLLDHDYSVLALDDALARLRNSTLPPSPVVLTFDDGMYGTWKHAVPLLRERRLPATIYVTSYYAEKGGLIYRLAVQYMFWKAKTRAPRLSLEGLAPGLEGSVSLNDPVESDRETWRVIEAGERGLDEPGRRRLLEALAKRLDVDYCAMLESRGLGVMNPDEIAAAAAAGFDIQLHTHRHTFPADEFVAMREIADNRRVLERLAGRRLHHFCYPSGVWTRTVFPYLQAAEVHSAVTCDPGFNYPSTHPLALNRFIDTDGVEWVEFEAEMAGFRDLVRRGLRR